MDRTRTEKQCELLIKRRTADTQAEHKTLKNVLVHWMEPLACEEDGLWSEEAR